VNAGNWRHSLFEDGRTLNSCTAEVFPSVGKNWKHIVAEQKRQRRCAKRGSTGRARAS
jgi:hypothetical protein